VAFPVIALLASRGATFLWRGRPLAQAVAVLLLLGTSVWGIHGWIAPLR
jgi:hypothetical protein